MKPKVLLIFCLPVDYREFLGALLPPLMLECIAGNIRDIADVCIFDVRVESGLERKLKEFQPDIIGINIKNTVRSRYAYQTAKLCREICPDALLIAGGLHATVLPEETLNEGFDVVVRGDGERTTREIVEKKRLNKILGISYKRNRRFIHNENRPFEKNLDIFPHPARDSRLPKANYSVIQGMVKADIIETSRGCTNYCTFCSPASFHKGSWRYHSPEYVIEELKQIPGDAKLIMVTDDNFTADLKRVERICDGIIEEGIDKIFIIQIRPMLGNTGLKKKMVKAGFTCLNSGAETLSKKNLRKYHKGLNPDTMKIINQEWRKAGAKLVMNSFVFGDPEDTEKDLLAIGDFARENSCHYADIIWLTPYPGTPYREELEKKGLLISNDWKKYSQGYQLVRNLNVSDKRMKELRYLAWCRFFSPRVFSNLVISFISYFCSKLNLGLFQMQKFIYRNRHLFYGNNYEYDTEEYSKKKIFQTYFRDIVNNFSGRERDMTKGFNDLVIFYNLNRFLRIYNNKTIQISIIEGEKNLTNIVAKIEDGKFYSLRFEREKDFADIQIDIELKDLTSIFTLEYRSLLLNLTKLFFTLRKMIRYNLYRRIVSF